eukprot:TRINITY_DN2945_c0_g1_i1.p1 TRINITY_DN2945_c0_g1~~TRINITY_DN2945_c0_g1_i1.p1  ORF type:complete len:394 (-),score=34.12 TRINITY_DN2945_c0_g1_i1:283-1407(-)
MEQQVRNEQHPPGQVALQNAVQGQEQFISETSLDLKQKIFTITTQEGGYLTSTAINHSDTAWATSDDTGLIKIHLREMDPQWQQDEEINVNDHIHYKMNQPVRVSSMDWAHTKFGHILAIGTDCGHILFVRKTVENFFDSEKAAFWKVEQQFWIKSQQINDIKCAPYQFGLLVAVAQGAVIRLIRGHDDLVQVQWQITEELQFCQRGSVSKFTEVPKVYCVDWKVRQPYRQVVLAAGGNIGLILWSFDVAKNGFRQLTLPDDCQNVESIQTLSWCPSSYGNGETLALGIGSQLTLMHFQGPSTKLEVSKIVQDQIGDCYQIAWDSLGLSFVVSCLTQPPQASVWMRNSAGVWNVMQYLEVGKEDGQDEGFNQLQ